MLRVETPLATVPSGAVIAYTVRLPYDQRRKTRQLVTLADGTELAIVLPRGTILRDGALLQADNGCLVRVEAAPQPVLVVTGPDHLTLTRAAYHLGNRHTPVELGPGYLRLEADPVLHDMLEKLGAHVEQRNEPFEPEPGAYGGGHRHGHEETFAEDHALAQHLFQQHARSHRHAPPPPQEGAN